MKKHKNVFAVCLVVAVLSLALMGFLSVGLFETSSEIAKIDAENTAEAILTSANLENSTAISVPVVYYDQEMDACVDMFDANREKDLEGRQFEWTGCGYYVKEVEPGMVEYELSSLYLPVTVGGDLLSNRGLNFNRWFAEVEGASRFYAGEISLGYNKDSLSFEYGNNSFYPLNEVGSVSSDGNNHLFTMSFGVPFRVLKNGKETFTISADDDTWVFVNNRLVLDMGGIHDAISGEFIINEEGEVYSSVDDIDLAYSGVKLEEDSAVIRIFHADRDSADSIFRIKFSDMVLNITTENIAKRDGGVELAYDPTDPSYVAPLGESITVKQNDKSVLAGKMMVQVAAIGGFGVLMVVAISVGWRYLRRGRNREE